MREEVHHQAARIGCKQFRKQPTVKHVSGVVIFNVVVDAVVDAHL